MRGYQQWVFGRVVSRTMAEDRQPALAIRLLVQMSRVRIIFAFALLVGIYTAPPHIVTNRGTAFAGISLAALLAVYSYFVADWAREYGRGRLNLSVALTVLGDVFALTLFSYGTGGAYSYFFALLLCDMVFVAVFFHGLEIVFIVGIGCGSYAIVTLAASSTAEVRWQVMIAIIAAVVLAWLANGLGRVLERERIANERLVRYLTEGVCLLDDRGVVLLANPELERLSGVALHNIIGHDVASISQYYRGGQLGRLFEDMSEVVKASEMMESDVELTEPEPIVLRRSTVPCLSSSGRAQGWVVIWQDITDITAAVRAQEEGLMVVTHEMRSPLTSLRLLVEILAGVTGELDEGERSQIIDHLGDETERLARLVASILDLARFERPDFQLERRPTDIGPLLERTEAIFAARSQEAEVTFVCQHPDTMPTVWADEDRLEQVLVNLCENALAHTPAEGRVTLSIAASEDALQFTVADTGVGIPEELQEQIFDKFGLGPPALAGAGRERSTGGLGLGLALTKRIVELHNGTITVDSAPGEGATFTVTIPLGHPVAGSEPASLPAATGSS